MNLHISRSVLIGSALCLSILFSTSTVRAQYAIQSEFGNLVDCDTMTRGIYCIWWDNDWNVSTYADVLLDTMLSYRNTCLGSLSMEDPPNPVDGYFYNVYLHQPNDVFPSWFGNGQGTDMYGHPYLTMSATSTNDWVNVAHETFHIFQYSANSPGFSYSGDSQWYIEASANWFAAVQNPGEDRALIEAESLVRLPHVPLWLSYGNFPSYYPQNWQRYVHQYALALLLYYLTEEAGVPPTCITQGLFANTTDLPQEYFYNQLGGQTFRDHFVDWAAHMTNDFDFLPANQTAANENEWYNYADLWDDNEYTETYVNTGSGGWYRPLDSLISTGWSFNTYKLENSTAQDYVFELMADAQGTASTASYFQGMVVVRNTNTGTTFHPLTMQNGQDGSLALTFTPDDTEAYFIIASMPEHFTDVDQLFGYDMRISALATGIPSHLLSSTREVVARYDLLGRTVQAEDLGVQIVHYSDGSVRKIYRPR